MIGTSYVSEKSVEYALVARVSTILRERYKHVIPLFPWAKREGSKLSMQIHAGRYFRVLAVYARRPKMIEPDSPHIEFSFNWEINLGAEMAMSHGIPAIAGCPVARNFFELANCSRFAWVNLRDCRASDVAQFVQLDYQGEILNARYAPKVFNDDELFRLVETQSRLLSLPDLMEAAKQIRVASGSDRFLGPFRVFAGYKPVYFLLA